MSVRLDLSRCLDDGRCSTSCRSSQIKAQLHPRAIADAGSGSFRGRRPSGNLHGRDGRAPVSFAEQVARLQLLLAGHPRQPLDERSELVLAEKAQNLVAVVVAESRRLEVQLDRDVRANGDERPPAEDVVAVLLELDAQL